MNKYNLKELLEKLERCKNVNLDDVKLEDVDEISSIKIDRRKPSNERMSYQRITDLFIATSSDYNPKSESAYTFFKIVQNKLHFAISGHTAAELIYERANSEKEHMGLTNWLVCPL